MREKQFRNFLGTNEIKQNQTCQKYAKICSVQKIITNLKKLKPNAMNKDFVSKLSEMLKEDHEQVKWNSEGTEFQITDLQGFKDNLLPIYFRHERFDSFVRQLNMYGFHKISRRKNELIFHHEFFIRGRQEQYYMIKRKCKNDGNGGLKELINYKIGEEMKRMEDCEPNFAELLKQLLQFKQKTHQNNRKLKGKIDKLIREVSWKKRRQIKSTVTDIKESLSEMDHAYKNLHEIVNKKYNKNQNSSTVENSQNSQSQKILFSSSSLLSSGEKEEDNKMSNFYKSEHGSFPQFHSFKSISNFFV